VSLAPSEAASIWEGALQALRPTQARIDLDRLEANYRILASYSPVPVMPVVKADAYGHGAAMVAARLEALGAPLLAVGYPEEGVTLRRAGVQTPIVVMAGFTAGQARALVEHDLTPVLATPRAPYELEREARAASRRVPVHLKVDTGMSRLGLPPETALEVASWIVDSEWLQLEGFMTHLASADEQPAATEAQLDAFDACLARLADRDIRPRFVHAANSAGMSFLRPGHTLARPGLLLYGLRPRPLSPAVEVRPVMALLARVSLVKDVASGTRVSYGGIWSASRRSRIATVPVGYADGVPRTRTLSERGSFAVGGGRARVAGAVCMDLTMLDVTDLPAVREGDEVVVFGDDPSAWEIAEWAGTNPWHILTSVSARVPRVFVADGRILHVEYGYR
jgi:alanine racemase